MMYWGEHRGWYSVFGRGRDTSAEGRSNFAVLLARLGGEGATVAVDRLSHWAVGWVEVLLVKPTDHKALRIAIKAARELDNYPILDEEHYSALRYEVFLKWAKSELSAYERWTDALQSALEGGNYFIGEEASEWAAIEEAREQLKRAEELSFGNQHE